MLSRMLGYNLQTNLTKRKRQTENLNSQRILANSKGYIRYKLHWSIKYKIIKLKKIGDRVI